MFPQQLKLIETQTKRLNLRLSGVLTWALQVSDVSCQLKTHSFPMSFDWLIIAGLEFYLYPWHEDFHQTLVHQTSEPRNFNVCWRALKTIKSFD